MKVHIIIICNLRHQVQDQVMNSSIIKEQVHVVGHELDQVLVLVAVVAVVTDEC